MLIRPLTLAILMASTLAISHTAAAQSSNDIVGGWYIDEVYEISGQNQGRHVFTFLANGEYFAALDGDSTIDPTGQDGMERGTYSWDPVSGSVDHATLVDTNGEWGLSDSGVITATVLGDLLTVQGTWGTMTANRVVSNSNPIVGSWYMSNQGESLGQHVFTFLADGEYFASMDGDSTLDPDGQDGMERGTYAWNELTGELSHQTLVDTNREWGLSDSGDTIAFLVSGNTAVASGDWGEITWSRVTPVPEPETYALMLAGLGLVSFAARLRKGK